MMIVRFCYDMINCNRFFRQKTAINNFNILKVLFYLKIFSVQFFPSLKVTLLYINPCTQKPIITSWNLTFYYSRFNVNSSLKILGLEMEM